MELIKQSIRVCDTAARGNVQAMADGDVIVPDVKPDILKLLQVDAEASVTDKYIENGRLVAVSYTHLDVYKRQIHDRSDQISGTEHILIVCFPAFLIVRELIEHRSYHG